MDGSAIEALERLQTTAAWLRFVCSKIENLEAEEFLESTKNALVSVRKTLDDDLGQLIDKELLEETEAQLQNICEFFSGALDRRIASAAVFHLKEIANHLQHQRRYQMREGTHEIEMFYDNTQYRGLSKSLGFGTRGRTGVWLTENERHSLVSHAYKSRTTKRGEVR